MSKLFQDLVTLLFSNGKAFVEKAEEYKSEREKRYQDYRENKKDEKKQSSEKCSDEFQQMKESLFKLTRKLGFVPRSEVDELKQQINELNKKIENLQQNEKD